jgi:hypothetical protein
MPMIIDFHKTQYKYIANPNGTGKYTVECIFNGMLYKKSFVRAMNIRVARVNFHCYSCDKERAKGTRYVGGHYDRVCLFCLEEWIKHSSNTLKEMNKMVLDLGKQYKKNHGEWNKEAIVGNLTNN